MSQPHPWRAAIGWWGQPNDGLAVATLRPRARGRTVDRVDVTSTPSGVTIQALELTGPPNYGEVEIE